MERGNTLGLMEECTKVGGRIANCMGMESINGLTVVHTKATISMIRSMGKEYIHGLKVKSTTADGARISNMAKQFLQIQRGNQEEDFGIWEKEKAG